MRLVASGIASTLFACAAWCQTAPAFEVASVKSNKSGGTGIGGRICVRGQVQVRNAPLQHLVAEAWSVRPEQILQAPSWFNDDRFDIEAKPVGSASGDVCYAMLRNLLTERFALTAHKTKKPALTYTLVVSKGGPKLHIQPPGEQGTVYDIGHFRGTFTIAMLARALESAVEAPIKDATGLTATYLIDLQWAPDPASVDEAHGLAPLVTALQEQLGLKLEAHRAPVDFLVIDHVERIPSEN